MENSMQQTAEQVITLITTYGMSVIGAVVILVVGFTVAKWLSRAVYKALGKAPNMDETLARFLSSLVRYAVLAFTIMAALSKFGIQTASLVAVMGAAGLAIGLALQGTLSHVASGVMLLLFRPFKIGDYVEVGGHAGTVDNIGLFTTELTMPDNVQIIIPNGQVWDGSVTNYSFSKTRRVEVVLGISYDDSIDKAIDMINGIIKDDERIMDDPEPGVVVAELAGSSVNIRIRVWCKSSDYWPLTFDLNKTLKNRCDEEGISIPYPHQTLHIVSDKDSL